MKTIKLFTLIVLATTMLVSINSCTTEDEINYDLVGDWKVVSYEDYETHTKITKTKENTWYNFNNGDIRISFSSEDTAKGKFSGVSVTNHFFGEYTTYSEGEIEIESFFATLMNEPEWTDNFQNIIYAESYEIRNGRLIIYYNQKKNSITFIKN